MEEQSEPSLIIFTSITLILLVFFVYLSSKRQFNQQRIPQILASVHQQFKIKRPTAQKPIWVLELERLANTVNLPIETKNNNTTLNFINSDLFHSGDEISASELASLIALANLAREQKLTIEIKILAGNIACLPHSFETPWELAVKRAQTMYRFFLDNSITPDLIHAEATLSNESYIHSSECNPVISGRSQLLFYQPS